MTQDIQDKVNIIAGAFQPVIDAANAIPALVDAREAEKLAEGIEIGKGMIVLPDPANPDAQYTQAQMDEAVTNGKAQQKGEDDLVINAQSLELAALKQQLVDLQGVADKAVSDYETLKADVLAAEVDNEALVARLKG